MPRMTAEQRIRAAQDNRRRANSDPTLKPQQRQNLRRVASNLVKLNVLEAKRGTLLAKGKQALGIKT